MLEWHRDWCDFLNPDLILEFGGVFLVSGFFLVGFVFWVGVFLVVLAFSPKNLCKWMWIH